jgi:hypothetical protein
MTILAGLSFSRQGSAPINLAAQIARCTGEKVIAAVIISNGRGHPKATLSRTSTCAMSRRRLRAPWTEWSVSWRGILTSRRLCTSQLLFQQV